MADRDKDRYKKKMGESPYQFRKRRKKSSRRRSRRKNRELKFDKFFRHKDNE